jgi:hypothetical protein
MFGKLALEELNKDVASHHVEFDALPAKEEFDLLPGRAIAAQPAMQLVFVDLPERDAFGFETDSATARSRDFYRSPKTTPG